MLEKKCKEIEKAKKERIQEQKKAGEERTQVKFHACEF
jgi:hypothetical protein